MSCSYSWMASIRVFCLAKWW